MVNNFSVDKVSLYINWANIYLFIILDKLQTLNLPIFSDEILVSNYHSCKGETIYLIPHFMIDVIYKTVKLSHLEKLKIDNLTLNLIT